MIEDTSTRTVLAAVRTAVAPWLRLAGRHAGPTEIVAGLRAAAAAGGPGAALWRQAAAVADAAAWVVDDEGDTARDLWATVREYAERAAEADAVGRAAAGESRCCPGVSRAEDIEHVRGTAWEWAGEGL
ncbi:hypothetical protein [Streptomyces sp. NPDC051162]|uniref:hypothetical protein n=1 Tax=Streptomyces sp. NPDC051162 TaxID=3154747 RepID=UPI0034189AA0